MQKCPTICKWFIFDEIRLKVKSAYPGCSSLKHLGVFLLALDGLLVHHRVFPFEISLTRTWQQLDYNHCHQSSRPDFFSFEKLYITCKVLRWINTLVWNFWCEETHVLQQSKNWKMGKTLLVFSRWGILLKTLQRVVCLVLKCLQLQRAVFFFAHRSLPLYAYGLLCLPCLALSCF